MIDIPKVIHYCWFGPKPLPKIFNKCYESWKKFCPDYEIKFWNENNFNIYDNKYLQIAYEKKQFSKFSNLARLLIVFRNGGIYLDTDVELVNTLDTIIHNEGFLGFESSSAVNTGLGFGFKKGNVILQKLINNYITYGENFNDKLGFKVCHEMDTPILNELGLVNNGKTQIISGVKILSSEYLCPKSIWDYESKISSKTLSIHHFEISYSPYSDKLKKIQKIRRFMSKILGKKVEQKVFSVYLIILYLKNHGLKRTIRKVLRTVKSNLK